MSEKCFCHLNGYKVKDADARAEIKNLKAQATELLNKITQLEESGGGNYVEKNTSESTLPQLYGKRVDGSQSMYEISNGSSVNGAIVQRMGFDVLVPTNPIYEEGAVNKKYVDEKIAQLGTGTGGKPIYKLTINASDFEDNIIDTQFIIYTSENITTKEQLFEYIGAGKSILGIYKVDFNAVGLATALYKSGNDIMVVGFSFSEGEISFIPSSIGIQSEEL